MKKILITGANSFIGSSFENFIKENHPNEYIVDTIDMVDKTWKNKDFSKYDTVFHVAGIAHLREKKLSVEKEKFCRFINTDLTIETATKAKRDGVKQFIFLSSASVYGDSSKIGRNKVITKDTPVNPSNWYGDSKLQAEKGILLLQDRFFKVCILRPPIIYGKGCNGKYSTLAKIAHKFPLFPNVQNLRSMLYIDNLSEFVRLIIDNEENGIFFPQNAEYSNTSKMVQSIALVSGKKVKLVKGLCWILKIAGIFNKSVNNAFGSFIYDQSMSEYKNNYRIYSLEQSVKKTES